MLVFIYCYSDADLKENNPAFLKIFESDNIFAVFTHLFLTADLIDVENAVYIYYRPSRCALKQHNTQYIGHIGKNK